VIQGTAADILKVAMLRAHAALSDMRTKLVLTVHDELLFEAPDDEVEAAKKIVLCEMEGAYELEPPLEVDVGVGVNWTDAK
jgi:DNA polymerase-1